MKKDFKERKATSQKKTPRYRYSAIMKKISEQLKKEIVVPNGPKEITRIPINLPVIPDDGVIHIPVHLQIAEGQVQISCQIEKNEQPKTKQIEGKGKRAKQPSRANNRSKKKKLPAPDLLNTSGLTTNEQPSQNDSGQTFTGEEPNKPTEASSTASTTKNVNDVSLMQNQENMTNNPYNSSQPAAVGNIEMSTINNQQQMGSNSLENLEMYLANFPNENGQYPFNFSPDGIPTATVGTYGWFQLSPCSR